MAKNEVTWQDLDQSGEVSAGVKTANSLFWMLASIQFKCYSAAGQISCLSSFNLEEKKHWHNNVDIEDEN